MAYQCGFGPDLKLLDEQPQAGLDLDIGGGYMYSEYDLARYKDTAPHYNGSDPMASARLWEGCLLITDFAVDHQQIVVLIVSDGDYRLKIYEADINTKADHVLGSDPTGRLILAAKAIWLKHMVAKNGKWQYKPVSDIL